MRGHPQYIKTRLQGTLWWEDTLYTVKPIFKGHSDERTPSIYSKKYPINIKNLYSTPPLHGAHTVKLGYIKLSFYEYMVYIEVLSRRELNPIYFHVK